MPQWNEPNPNTTGVNGFPARAYRHYKLFKQPKIREGFIATEGAIGFFPDGYEGLGNLQAEMNAQIKKIKESKILDLPCEPKKCRDCDAYMVLKRNGEGYTCVNPKHKDKNVQKRLLKKDLDRRLKGKTPLCPRISTEELKKILKA